MERLRDAQREQRSLVSWSECYRISATKLIVVIEYWTGSEEEEPCPEE